MLCQGVDKGFSCARSDSAQDSSVCCINVTPQECYSITQDKPRNTNEKRRLRRVASYTGVNRLKLSRQLVPLPYAYLYRAPRLPRILRP